MGQSHSPHKGRYMAVWLYGCTAVLLYVSVWLYGCMAVWLYESAMSSTITLPPCISLSLSLLAGELMGQSHSPHDGRQHGKQPLAINHCNLGQAMALRYRCTTVSAPAPYRSHIAVLMGLKKSDLFALAIALTSHSYTQETVQSHRPPNEWLHQA